MVSGAAATMILQNRVALDYILSSQGGTCTLIGPECCSDVVDPSNQLKLLIEMMDHLRQQISGMNEVKTSWLKGFMGSFWGNILEICEIVLIFVVCLVILIASFTLIVKCTGAGHIIRISSKSLFISVIPFKK